MQQQKAASAQSFRISPALYEQKFALEIANGTSAKQLFDRALLEKERLHQQMAEIADQLWPKYFGSQIKPENRLEKINKLISVLSTQHTSVADFIPEVARQIPLLEAWVQAHGLLDLDASRPLQVRETPKYQRGFYIASINSPGPYDPTAKTFYNVSPLTDYSAAEADSFL